MLKAILFAFLFVVIGLIVVALLAPFLFQGADMRKMGATCFPFIVLGAGISGFIFGLWRSKKR